MMNDRLIKEFRNTVNDNGCCDYFWDRGQLKFWNCICSAMDWITDAVREINFDIKPECNGHCSSKSIEVMTLIMRVAMIKEAIEQLHRVFFADKDGKKAYRSEDHIVWKNNEFNWSDNQYFENLRACFGAHPVNLKGFFAENERSYAGWSYSDGGQFAVLVYSNSKEKDHKKIEISMQKLEEYANLRYQHLNDLINCIKSKDHDVNLSICKCGEI